MIEAVPIINALTGIILLQLISRQIKRKLKNYR